MDRVLNFIVEMACVVCATTVFHLPSSTNTVILDDRFSGSGAAMWWEMVIENCYDRRVGIVDRYCSRWGSDDKTG